MSKEFITSNSDFLDRNNRIEFSHLLERLYGPGTNAKELRDPVRFNLETWLGFSANTNVKDYADPILAKARRPKLIARVASKAVSATLLQNELTVYSGEAMADPTRYIRPQTKYMVNNRFLFTEQSSPDYPDEERAIVQTVRVIAEMPQTDYDAPLSAADFSEYLENDPALIDFLLSNDARTLAADMREPVESLRPMTTQDLDIVRGLIGEIVTI